jgi:ATP-binding cassette, subfamily B, bacterial MsbA
MLRAFVSTLRTLRRLFGRIRPSRVGIVVTVLLMILSGVIEGALVGMLVPLLSMLAGTNLGADSAIHRVLPFLLELDRTTQVAVLACSILLLVSTKNLLAYVALNWAGRLRASGLIELRRQLLDRILHAPPAILEKHTSGEVAGVFLLEATRVNRALDYLIALTQRAITVAGYFVALVVLSWSLMLATVGLGVVLGALSLRLMRRTMRVGREIAAANSELGRQVSESVGGLRVVRVTASEATLAESFAHWNRVQAEREIDGTVSQTTLTGITETLGVAGAMLLTWLAHAVWVADGSLDVSRFLAFSFGLLRLLPALNQVYTMQGSVASLVGSIEKALSWLDLPRYPVRPFGSRKLSDIRQAVTFNELGFAYPNGHEAIRSISFDVRAGETVALLGASGSGKSTLANLLARLREPTAGSILIDGVDHWEFEPVSFHRAVALVEQDSFLFNRSIAENVAYGAPWVTREDVLAAIHSVQLSDMIERLPQGVDTVVGERGATISGGQRQRLAIARAIVRDPKLLILDEPTSALDAETEREVVRAIDAASVGRTTLIITHRPSTVAHAARILRIEDGRLKSVEDQPRLPSAQVERGA